MESKYKEEIKGAILSSGIWAIIFAASPYLRNLYYEVDSSYFIGIGLIALYFMWK